VERAAARLERKRFELVFVDPPYADVKAGLTKSTLEALFVPLLEARGMLVLEHASRDPAPIITGLTMEDSRIYGDTALSFFVRADDASDASDSPDAEKEMRRRNGDTVTVRSDRGR
jgi:16S rRNA (guanine966-N2)-methyltransferase